MRQAVETILVQFLISAFLAIANGDSPYDSGVVACEYLDAHDMSRAGQVLGLEPIRQIGGAVQTPCG